MSSQFETGHGKNVANLQKFNQFLNTLAATYNPQAAAITLPAMETLYTNSKMALDTFKTAEDVWKSATNNREMAFSTLGALATRVLGMLRSTGAPQQTIEDLASLVAKIRGSQKRSAAPKPGAGADTNSAVPAVPGAGTRSTSQLSFDNRIENFSKMILLLQGVPAYAAAEADLSLAGLQSHHTLLVDLNNKATGADAKLKTARANRNTVLYAPETGMLDRVKQSKAYILGVFGRASSQYKNAGSYKFTRVLI